MPKLPQVSGDQLASLLVSLGCTLLRQRGSHMQFGRGTHRVTVPAHRSVAVGTLGDIPSEISAATGVSKDELIRRLR